MKFILKISLRESCAEKKGAIVKQTIRKKKHTIDKYLVGKSKKEKITMDKFVAQENNVEHK